MSLVTLVTKDAKGRSLEIKVSSDHCDRIFKRQIEHKMPQSKRWKLKREKKVKKDLRS